MGCRKVRKNLDGTSMRASSPDGNARPLGEVSVALTKGHV